MTSTPEQSKDEQLEQARVDPAGTRLTTQQGVRVSHTDDSLTDDNSDVAGLSPTNEQIWDATLQAGLFRPLMGLLGESVSQTSSLAQCSRMVPSASTVAKSPGHEYRLPSNSMKVAAVFSGSL